MSSKSILIRGQRFQLRRRAKVFVDNEEVDASCCPPGNETRFILIRRGLSKERELDVLIHEMLHGAFWDLDEGAIAETATDIARALTQLGYRCDSSRNF